MINVREREREHSNTILNPNNDLILTIITQTIIISMTTLVLVFSHLGIYYELPNLVLLLFF